MIETARKRVDRLVVLACARAEDEVDAATRAAWIVESLGGECGEVLADEETGQGAVEVIAVFDDLPEAPEPWAARALAVMADRRPDVALTGGESYGAGWAAAMGCEHCALQTRVTAATQLRADLRTHWDDLAGPARAHFSRRVTVLGVESSGTTTLSEALAVHFKTVWVPEYGRAYWEGRRHLPPGSNGWATPEFVRIARGQARAEEDLARLARSGLVVSDTDSFATSVWHRRYVGTWSTAVAAVSQLAARQRDLYILTAPDFDFVQDGTRDGEAIRHEMHAWFKAELTTRGLPHIVVGGSCEARLTAAVAAIEPLLFFPTLRLGAPPALPSAHSPTLLASTLLS